MTVKLDPAQGVTDEDLRRLSAGNPGYQFERSGDGRLIVSPTGTQGGRRSGEVFGQLRDWNQRTRSGVVFDSSSGFHLADGACLSPDASWLALGRWEVLTPEERKGIAPVCPDAAFEVRSEWDSLADLRAKMRAYLANGASVAVLVDPRTRSVEVHRAGARVERFEDGALVPLSPGLPGFILDARPVFAD